jgi:hypothetical protein
MNNIITTFLGIVAMTVGVAFSNVFPSYVYAIITSVVLVIITIFLHMMGSVTKELYYVSIVINLFATGLVVAGYYTYIDNPFIIDTIFFVAGLSLFGSIVLSFLLQSISDQSTKLIVLIFMILLVIGTTITVFISDQSLINSAFLFYSIVVSFQLVGYVSLKEFHDELMKHKSFLSFGVYLVVAFIVSLVITEGDSIQVLDINPSAISTNKQKKEL